MSSEIETDEEIRVVKRRDDAKLRHILIEAIYRQKRVFITQFVTVIIMTIAVILLMPKRYEANAKLIVENLRSRSSLSTQPVDRIVTTDDVSEMQMNSEVELLQSETVLRKALGLPPNAPEENVREMKAEQGEVKSLQGRLVVDPVRMSSLINVKLASSSPQDAVKKLNLILNAYFDERASLTRSKGAEKFFEREAQDFGEKLDADEADLAAFQQQHELVDMAEQKRLQVQRIAKLDDTIAETKAKLADQTGRSHNLVEKLGTVTPRAETTVRAVTNQYSQEHLGTALVEMENRRTELLHRYAPTDRQIVELDEKIATMQSAIRESGLHPAAERATDINPVWQQIQVLLVAANSEISGTAAQQAELMRQRRAAEDRLRELLQATGEYDDLTRAFTEVQQNYNLYVQKRDQARVSEALDSEKMFDVSLVQRPASGAEPVRPKPIPYFLAGLLLAFCLACGLALYADSSAERIYAPGQLDTLTRMQTIATISNEARAGEEQPAMPIDNALEYRKLLYTIRTMLGQVPEPGVTEPRGFCVAFTSALIGEGVSYVVHHLALEAATQVTLTVAVIDMKAMLAKAGPGKQIPLGMKRNEATGVWELVEGEGNEHDTAGLGVLDGDRFWASLDRILAQAKAMFSFVLLDCPSFRRSTLAMELDGHADGYVVVVGAGMVRKRQLIQVQTLLLQTSTPTIGFVLNRRKYPVPAWLYRMFW